VQDFSKFKRIGYYKKREASNEKIAHHICTYFLFLSSVYFADKLEQQVKIMIIMQNKREYEELFFRTI